MKRRQARSFEDAIVKIAGELSFPGAGEVIGKSEFYVRSASDPDHVQVMPIHYALELDVAYTLATGEPGPIFCTYQKLYDQLTDGKPDCETNPHELAGTMAIEGGQALQAYLDDGAPAHKKLRELEEARDAIEAAIRDVSAKATLKPVRGAA